jgi:hypothetical protein
MRIRNTAVSPNFLQKSKRQPDILPSKRFKSENNITTKNTVNTLFFKSFRTHAKIRLNPITFVTRRLQKIISKIKLAPSINQNLHKFQKFVILKINSECGIRNAELKILILHLK